MVLGASGVGGDFVHGSYLCRTNGAPLVLALERRSPPSVSSRGLWAYGPEVAPFAPLTIRVKIPLGGVVS